jgi:ParB-like chromosome segregation protein Spo0J
MNIPDELSPLLFPVADLHELPGNPRRGDVEAVRRSYEAFGQRKPIVARKDVDGRCVVVAGNHQLKAARELGWDQIAVVWADDLTDDEAKAFALADNRVADLGGYDDADLLAMLESVPDSDLLIATGYTDADLERLLNGSEPVELPEDFATIDPDKLATQYRCPSCEYEWSGSPKPGEARHTDDD